MTDNEYEAIIYELRQQQAAADEDVRRAYWAHKADPTSVALANRLDTAYYRQKSIVMQIDADGMLPADLT